MLKKLIVIAGGGGFIGGHLVADFVRRGHKNIRVIDKKPVSDWWQVFPELDNRSVRLAIARSLCDQALAGGQGQN